MQGEEREKHACTNADIPTEMSSSSQSLPTQADWRHYAWEKISNELINSGFKTRILILSIWRSIKGTLTCASSWITRYCSFQTVILETSSFLSARSFFNSGLQKVLMEFMEELSLLSLTSTSRRSISFSRRTWGGRIEEWHISTVLVVWQSWQVTL